LSKLNFNFKNKADYLFCIVIKSIFVYQSGVTTRVDEISDGVDDRESDEGDGHEDEDRVRPGVVRRVVNAVDVGAEQLKIKTQC
jgi:hypothetical protein